MKKTEIKLSTPIKHAGADLTVITLRPPATAGELKGVKVLDVLQLDTTAHANLFPRINTDGLTQEHFWGLPPVDMMAIQTAVVGFFVAEDTRAM